MGSTIPPTSQPDFSETAGPGNISITDLIRNVIANPNDKERFSQLQLILSRVDGYKYAGSIGYIIEKKGYELLEKLYYTLDKNCKGLISAFLVCELINDKNSSLKDVSQRVDLACKLDPESAIEYITNFLKWHPETSEITSYAKQKLNELVQSKNKDKPGCLLGWFLPTWIFGGK